MNVAVRATAVALAAQGHEVEILTRRTDPAASAVLSLAPNLTLRHLDAGPAERRIKGDHESYIADFRRALSPLGPYDLLHSHHWFSGMAALDVAATRGIPHVQSFHSIAADASTMLSAGERPESPGRLRGEAHLAQCSAAVLTVSEAERTTVIDRLGGSPERVTVIPPGVDASLFTPANTPAAQPGYIVAAARLEPLKGLDLAIEALAGLPAAIRPELILAGGPTTGHDAYPAELAAHARAHGLADSIRFVGPQSREDLAALLRGARMLLVPSHSETYGLVALEAAASGIPVVASASGGLVEAVADRVTGLLVDSRDPAAWTDAVRRLLEDPAFAARLGAAGRKHAEQLTWDRAATATAEVYAQLLAARAAS
ncbi:glycosyltransferase [Mycetocola manganoxydans]|uniref:Glycosyltransferase n=2 Tax=Mycetocola manganoxydans TaxID=699879 RepID=A0A3L6ZL16_9MICO|nr:glycosyltransferase [Mycetocola manganoxydans]